MEKRVQIFQCIISHSSTKSLVPPLHKFTIRNLGLFISLFGKQNSFKSAVYLLTCQYFGRMERKLFCGKGLHSADFPQFELRRYAMTESPRGTSRMFFSLYTGVSQPICSYSKLQADGFTGQGSVSVTMKQTSHPVNSKPQQKITYLILYCVKSD